MTLFGTSIRGVDVTPTFDQLNPALVRVYDDLYKFQSVTRRGKPVAFSMQTWDDNKVALFLRNALDGSVLIIKHEPEDDVESGVLPLATWRSWQLRLCDAIANSSRAGKVFPAVALMGWSLDMMSGRKIEDYLNVEVVAKFKSVPGAIIGFDRYASPNQTAGSVPTCKASDLYDGCRLAAQNLGLRWAIFETGVQTTSDPAAAAQAGWWPSAFDYARTHDAYCFLLWNSTTDATNGYQIWVQPSVVKVWQQAMAPAAPNGDSPAPSAPSYTQAQLDQAVASAVAAQKSADAVDTSAQLAAAATAATLTQASAVATAVATQKAAGDAALATCQAAAQAALQAEQASGAQQLAAAQAQAAAQLAAAQTAASAHLADLRVKADALLGKAQRDAAGVVNAARTTLHSVLQ